MIVIVRHQLLLGHGLVRDRHELQEVVDDLVLEDGCPQRRHRLRRLAVVLDHLALLTGKVAHPGGKGTLHLLLGDLDVGLRADLRQKEAKPHAPLRDLLILRAHRLLGALALFGEGLLATLHVGADLTPDGLELGLDQLLRQLERVPLVERIEQRALDLLAARRSVSVLHLLAQRGTQRLEVLHPEPLRERIVERGILGRCDGLHDDVEHGLATGKVLGGVLLREGDCDLALLTGRRADELLLEARDEATLADGDVDAFGAATLERLTLHAADEVDGQPVAVGGGTLDRLVVEVALGERLQLGLDLLVGDRDDGALDGDRLQAGHLDGRQHLVLDVKREVAVAGKHLAHGALVEVDVGLQRWLLFALLDRLLDAGRQHVVDDLGHRRAAVHLAQVRHRHLAGAKPLQLHLGAHVVEVGGQPFVERRSRDDDPQLPLQTLGPGLRHFHRLTFRQVRRVRIVWGRRSCRAAIAACQWAGPARCVSDAAHGVLVGVEHLGECHAGALGSWRGLPGTDRSARAGTDH